MPKPISTGPLADEREVFLNPPAHAGSPPTTRGPRRAKRRRSFLAAKDGRVAAQLARVDYKIANDSGALTPPQKTRLWHRNGRLNGHAPPPGRAWDRAGPTRVVAQGDEHVADSTTE